MQNWSDEVVHKRELERTAAIDRMQEVLQTRAKAVMLKMFGEQSTLPTQLFFQGWRDMIVAA